MNKNLHQLKRGLKGKKMHLTPGPKEKKGKLAIELAGHAKSGRRKAKKPMRSHKKTGPEEGKIQVILA